MYIAALNNIIKDFNNSVISKYLMNVVLGARPPLIAENEEKQ